MKTKRADQLALQDVIQFKGHPCAVVAVGFTDMTAQFVRVAFRDPYTPPEAFKEDTFSADHLFTVNKEVPA